MMIGSIIMTVLIVLCGGALVVAAFNMKRMVAWEDRVLISLADSVQQYRETLEEEQLLLQQNAEENVQTSPVEKAVAQRTAVQRKKNRAA